MPTPAVLPVIEIEPGVDPRAAWIARHQGAIWRYLRYLGCDREAAADLLHDALLLGLRHGVDQRPEGQARAWLRSTARNLSIDRSRRLRRRPPQDDAALAEAVWQQQEEQPRLAALRECLRLLDGRARRALELRYRDGAARGAIGAALGLGEEGTKSLLQRAREALRRCIERRCAEERCDRGD